MHVTICFVCLLYVKFQSQTILYRHKCCLFFVGGILKPVKSPLFYPPLKCAKNGITICITMNGIINNVCHFIYWFLKMLSKDLKLPLSRWTTGVVETVSIWEIYDSLIFCFYFPVLPGSPFPNEHNYFAKKSQKLISMVWANLDVISNNTSCCLLCLVYKQ